MDVFVGPLHQLLEIRAGRLGREPGGVCGQKFLLNISPDLSVYVGAVFEGLPPDEGPVTQDEVELGNFSFIRIPICHGCSTVDSVQQNIRRDSVFVLLTEE